MRAKLASLATFSPNALILVFMGRALERVTAADLQQETNRDNSLGFSPDGRFFGYDREDATLVMARNPFACDPCDTNSDGSADLIDVEAFIACLVDAVNAATL